MTRFGRSFPAAPLVLVAVLPGVGNTETNLPVGITATVAVPTNKQAHKELALSVPVIAAVAPTDLLKLHEPGLSVLVAATVTEIDTYHPGSAGNTELGLSIPIVGVVTTTDQADFHDPGLSIPVVGAVTLTAKQGTKELALAVPITATVTPTAKQTNKELVLSIPVTGAVTATDLIHRKELALSSPIVGTTTLSVDQADLDELALSIPVVGTTAVTTAFKGRELDLSISASVTTTLAVDRAVYKNLSASLPITCFVTVVDLQQSPGHFDETQRIVLITSAIALPVDQAKYHESAITVLVTASVTSTDARHIIEPTVSVSVAATMSVTTFVHFMEAISFPAAATMTLSTDRAVFGEHPLSIGIGATVTCTDVRSGEAQTLSIPALAVVTATDQAHYRQLGLPIGVSAVVIGADSLGVTTLLTLLITATVIGTDFKSRVGITVLNDADALFLGDEAVSKIYVGTSQLGHEPIIYAGYGGIPMPTTTTDDLTAGARNYLRDFPQYFEVDAGVLNVLTVRLPHPLVTPSSLQVYVGSPASLTTEWQLDERAGLLKLTNAIVLNEPVVVAGYHYTWFSDADLAFHVGKAVHEIQYGSDISVFQPVHYDVIMLGGVVSALWSLAMELSLDIDVSTPEGMFIPARQRFTQVIQMLQNFEKEYQDKAAMLNMGLNSLDQSRLRRVAYMTGRFVPVYIDREFDDPRPPERIYPPIPEGTQSTDVEVTDILYDNTLSGI